MTSKPVLKDVLKPTLHVNKERPFYQIAHRVTICIPFFIFLHKKP